MEFGVQWCVTNSVKLHTDINYIPATQYLKQQPKDQYPEAIDPITGEIDPNRLPESVKASIRDLSSAIATVSGGLTGVNHG